MRCWFPALAVVFFTSACEGPGPAKMDNQKRHAGVTWSEHIAPIIFSHCSNCHRPGESGPFELLSYRDAASIGRKIRFVTKSRYMPPWPADPSYTHFANENYLTQDQIDLIADWVEQGMARGDSTKEPQPPLFHSGSSFGKPDLVVRCLEPVQIKGNGTDVFLVMKFPYKMDRDTFADLIEFVPHRRKLVHHVNGHLINYDEKRPFNYFTGKSVHADTRSGIMEVYMDMHIPYTDKKQPLFPPLSPNAVYYLPGYFPPAYPPEIGGLKLKKNGLFLLNNIHYGPSNTDLVDSSYINVFFRKEKVTRPLNEAQIGTFGLSPVEPALVIPANEIKRFHTSLKLTKTISLLSVNPHMHLLGKNYLAYAIMPGGDTVPLIRINKWNFRWQYYYTFKYPVKLEAGTVIHVHGTFDNTSKNPDNPFYPPRTITEGNGIESMKTSEEMFQFIFTYLPYKAGDEKINLERVGPRETQKR
jgi:mono/diheme cytochrome c family protein